MDPRLACVSTLVMLSCVACDDVAQLPAPLYVPPASAGPGDASEGETTPPPETTPDVVADPPEPEQGEERQVGRTPDQFDPLGMYLLADVRNYDGGQGVVDLAALDRVVGWVSPSTARVRPSDGRLVYRTHDGGLSEFHCDGSCEFRSTGSGERDEDSHVNDVELVLFACPDDRVWDFRYTPDGSLFYKCDADSAWHDAEGRAIEWERSVIESIHDHGLVLTRDLRSFAIRDLDDSTVPPVIALQPAPFEAPELYLARPVEDGFLMLFVDIHGDDLEPELWHLGFAGEFTRLGAYPPNPTGVIVGTHALDGFG